jgi:hypothetical protein
VQISVLLAFDCEASQSLDEVETSILDAGRRAMREALELTVRGLEDLARHCPCGGDTTVEGSDSRVVLATFGRVELRVRRLRCRECGVSYRPSESFLACLEGANVSGKLKEVAVLAGSSWPYETAVGVLGKLCGAEISHETVRQVTNAAGKAEAEQELEEAKRVVEPSLEEAKADEARDLEARLAAAGKPTGPRLLLVGMDGGWIPSREQSGGMEGKVAVVAVDPQPIGKPTVPTATLTATDVASRHRLAVRAYVATFAGSQELGLLAYAAARTLGVERAERQEVLGDGAKWIKTESHEHFPDALTVLDWGHVSRTYYKAIRAARPGKQAQAERRRLYRSVGDALWHGQADSAIETLRSLRPKPEEGREAEPIRPLEAAIAYFESQKAWLRDYQELQDKGYPVGSGMVEREVALVINRRMKRQGMRWKRETADAVVTLRTQTINADWETSTKQSARAQAA